MHQLHSFSIGSMILMSRRSCHSCCGAACCWSSMSRSCAGAAMSTAEAARSRHPRKHTPLRAGTIRPGHSARRSASSSAGLPPRTLMCRETTCRRSRCRGGTRPHQEQSPRSEGLQGTARVHFSRGGKADAGRRESHRGRRLWLAPAPTATVRSRRTGPSPPSCPHWALRKGPSPRSRAIARCEA